MMYHVIAENGYNGEYFRSEHVGMTKMVPMQCRLQVLDGPVATSPQLSHHQDNVYLE
jgi:hypothetical protein